MNSDLFPEFHFRKPDPLPEPCEFPYFIVAYWSRDKRWKIFPGMYSDPEKDEPKREAKELQEKGWTHVHFLKLPAKLWTDIDG